MKISATDREIRKFGLMFAAIAAGIAAYSYFRHGAAWPWWTGAAAFFLITGLLIKPALRPIYKGWMAFAFVLGWINTRLILGIFFYFVFTPVGLILRLTGKDLLQLKLDRSSSTYWVRREAVPFDAERYKRIF
jgi:hypothetical protein